MMKPDIGVMRDRFCRPRLVQESRAGQADRINTCIACTKPLPDHVFEKPSSKLFSEPIGVTKLTGDDSCTKGKASGSRRPGGPD